MAKRKSSSKKVKKFRSTALATREKPKCKARLKTCRKCGYRFDGGDRSWECPTCGESRRCKTDALTPYAVCRVHGAKGGRPPIHGKYSIPSKYVDRFNQIRQDPELMSLAYNIALSETRTDELLQQIHENDAMAAHLDILAAIGRMEYDVQKLSNFINRLQTWGEAEEKEYDRQYKVYKKAKAEGKKLKAPVKPKGTNKRKLGVYNRKLAKYKKAKEKLKELKPPAKPKGLTPKALRSMASGHKFERLYIGIAELKRAVEPRRIEAHLWQEISFHLELTRRLNDTERKWATAHDQMVPIGIALEAIRTVMRDALEFITNPKDRHRFSQKILGYLGER